MTTIVNHGFTVNKRHCSVCEGVGFLPLHGPFRPGEPRSFSSVACTRCGERSHDGDCKEERRA
jgi:ribosomal protein L37E